MKTKPLLFSLPLLVSVLAAQAAPRRTSALERTVREYPEHGVPTARDTTLISGRIGDDKWARDYVSSQAAEAVFARAEAISAWADSEPVVTTVPPPATEPAKESSTVPPAATQPAKESSTVPPAATEPAKESSTVPPATTGPSTPVDSTKPEVDGELTEMVNVSLAPCESRTLRIHGRKMGVDILTDRMHVRPQQGRGYVRHLPGMKSLNDADVEATRHDLRGVDRADLIAYPQGRARKDANKFLITRRVCVRLTEGVAFSKFARRSGAVVAERPRYADEAMILSYVTALDALDAVDRLSAMPEVLSAHILIAREHIPEFIPAPVTYFSGGGPEYAPIPKTDNVDNWVPPLFLGGILGTQAYQWWANNIATIPVPPPLTPIPTEFTGFLNRGGPRLFPGPAPVPSRVDLGDLPPINYNNATTPLFSGELTDMRMPLAWENKGDFDRPVSGNMRKVLIIDDGIQKAHPDLFNAVDLNTQRHWNYFNNQASAEPVVNSDTHGTSMAGIVGARIKAAGSRVTGVAPACIFHGVVALKGFVDDLEWADAFAFSAPPASGPNGGPPEGQNRGTIKDSDRDNEWLDEVRSGVVFFEIALNAQSNLGSQDATDLFTEDWLWKRAIRFSATRGNALKGVPFITSSGNGAEGHMDLNYMEVKNCIYQIPVGGVSDMGRRIAYSVGGAPLVCVAPTWGQELPPYLNWPSAPNGWPPNRVNLVRKNAPIGPDDLPFPWRRVSQGIVSTTNTAFGTSGIDFNLAGTSTSAAMVAGVCALMAEVNPQLTARDYKEILMRASRVVGDIRVDRGPTNSLLDDDIIADDTVPVTIGNQTYQLKTGQMWRMSPMGHPIHPFFGAGLVDADKAVKIARNWKPLPINPLPPIQRDVLKPGFGNRISDRNTETGGLYFQTGASQLIPTNGTALDIIVPSPPAGLRLEHIEVRVRSYHKRRGDLEIKLIAPGSVGWEKGRELESELYVPHRDDYNEDRYSSVNPELNDAMDWTFSTVRHWGTIVEANTAGVWKVRIRDAVTQGRTDNPTTSDPVFAPVDNPTDPQSQRLDGVAITYHGTYGKAINNSPPEVTTGALRFEPATQVRTAQMKVADLGRNLQTGEIYFPVTSWDVWSNTVTRVDGRVVPNYTPVQPTAPPVDFFEFFPPQARDPVDPNIHVPISSLSLPPYWPLQPEAPMWVSFLLDPAARPPTWPPPPTSGPVGALTQRPRWLEMTPDELWMIVRDTNNNNPATNFIHARLNRLTGLLEVIPHNRGKYFINIYAENLLGLSKPKELEITVTPPGYQSWADLFWDPPELSDPAWQGPVSGWLADPDGDGLVNGFEYAMRLNPTIPDTAQIPAYRIEENEPGIEDDEIVFSWSKDQLAIDADLRPQISEDLESWANVDGDAIQVGSGANGMADWEYRLPLLGDPKIFFRLWSDYNKNPGNP